jgi:hypothetical protein
MLIEITTLFQADLQYFTGDQYLIITHLDAHCPFGPKIVPNKIILIYGLKILKNKQFLFARGGMLSISFIRNNILTVKKNS